MFKRAIALKLEQALTRSPVVLLTGARQTGKTTLIKQIGEKNGYNYVTFDDLRYLSAAQTDPLGFITELKKPVILDEVQRVPELFLVIKQDVDEHREPGRYALTGSANPLLIPRLGEYLVGRMEIFTLFPLSQGELRSRQDTFIDSVFAESISAPSDVCSRQELERSITVGGYPLAQQTDTSARESWFNAYVTLLLQREVKDLANISKLAELPHLLNLLATRVGSLLNVAELSRTAGIATSTLHRYLTLFETLFLIDLLLPWSSNLGKRLVKSPKIYGIDTGLVTFLQGMSIQRLAPSPHTGSLLENFVVAELRKQITWSNARVKLFHARTASGIEVDCILEDAAGRMVGIEIKNAQTVTQADFKGLRHVAEHAQDLFVCGIVLYTGSQHVPFGRNLHALPINTLWENGLAL